MKEKELHEIDAWIAEHVMGFQWIGEGVYYLEKPEDKYHGLPTHLLPEEDGLVKSIAKVPHYSTEPAAALEVLKKCGDKLTFISEIEISHPINNQEA